MSPEPLRYSVLGTCVTLDSAEVGRAPLGRPVRHFTRTRIQSVVSTPTPIDADEITHESGFERRVALNEHRKTAAQYLRTLKHPLLVDLGDERLHLYRTGHGLITATKGYADMGLLAKAGVTRVKNDHELKADGPFAEACRQFAALLRPDLTVVVHRTFWATREADGSPVARIEESRRHNSWLVPAYDLFINALGTRARVVDMPEELRVPDPHSRWGHEPFHFGVEYHEHFTDSVRRVLSYATAGA